MTNPKYLSDPKFFYTPPNSMYERNHNLIPEIEVEDYELYLMKARTEEAEENAEVLSFEKLREIGNEEVICYIECGGSKRKYLKEHHAAIKGLSWTTGAIGNAKYKGISVRKLLLEVMGCSEESLKGKHLVAVAGDADF
jgi:DMSO/TMAO reductase YedYZ molybdopterin-dependent catalytic subunit